MGRYSTETIVSFGRKSHRISLRAARSGEDLVVIVNGGDKHHVGAIAVGIPRPSLKNPGKTSSTVSVFNLTGHKDEAIARDISERMTSSLNRVVVVIAGVHMNDASEQDIEKLLSNSKECTERALKEISK
ncbi:MAG TPA: hypothetical protein VJ574_04190 [Candidatus Bathyarchaeia archaeon]|nr:hypothetical protein [Candidatus Bathyarchaeia archaeon]